ncbi:MAG: hypothetical protein U0411_09650 [Thermodesulfovibrionales bacterium]
MRLKEMLTAQLRRKRREDEEPADLARDAAREVSAKEKKEAQSEGQEDAPPRRQRSSFALAMFVALVLLTGVVVYKRLPSASPLYKKDFSGKKQDAVSPASPLAAAPQATGSAVPSSPVRPKRSIYLPARDILSGSGTAELQKQEELNRLLEARVKELKLKNDIKKIEGDIEILPFQVTEKKKDLSEKIEKKANLQPVLLTEKESRPPTLYSVQMIEGIMTGSFTLFTGEQVKARAGDWAGEFVVRELTHTSASLEGRGGRKYLVSLSFPERYPVSSPLFGTKSSGTGPSAQAVPAVAAPASRQPVPVSISPVGRQ